MADIRVIEELYRALRMTNEVNELILRANEEELLLSEICRIIVDVGGYRLAWVGLAKNDDEKRVVPAAIYGIAKEYADTIKVSWDEKSPFGQGPTGRAIRSGATVTSRVNDAGFSPWRERAQDHGLRAAAALPMHLGDKVIGAINIYAADSGAFSDDELMLLERMADNLAYGLQSIRTATELKMLHTAILELSQPVFITDTEGRIEYVNKAFSSTTGYGSGEAVGQTPSILKSTAHPPEFYRAIWDTLLKGEGWKGKIINRMKDGRLREEWLAITPLRSPQGKTIRFACLITDIA